MGDSGPIDAPNGVAEDVKSSLLTTTVSVSESEIVCCAAGEIDLSSAPELNEAVATALTSSDATTFILDLTDVSFMDSTGLRVVITLHNVMRDRGGRLVVRKPSETVSTLLEITSLTTTLDIER